MESFRFADNLDSEGTVALGLSAPRLALLGAGGALAWAVSQLPGPAPLHLVPASLISVATVVLAWGRTQGVPLARWCWLGMGFARRRLTRAWWGETGWAVVSPAPGEPGAGARRTDEPTSPRLAA
ncbi:MAG: hypothetical protein ACREN7_05470 [Candidatus Dormibacteria bacterium]